MPYTKESEGNLTVELPDNRYFRFEQCNTYSRVSAYGITEVDFVWMAERDDRIWIMELKDYGPDSQGELSEALESLRNELPKNLVHAFLLVASVWSETSFGRRLRADIEATFPSFPSGKCSVCAAAVIRLENPADHALLLALQDAIQSAVEIIEFEVVVVLPAGSDQLEDNLGIRISDVA